MSFIGVEVEQETSAPPPKKNPGSAPAFTSRVNVVQRVSCLSGFHIIVLNPLNMFSGYRADHMETASI